MTTPNHEEHQQQLQHEQRQQEHRQQEQRQHERLPDEVRRSREQAQQQQQQSTQPRLGAPSVLANVPIHVVPTQDRLSKPHSVCDIRNNDPVQVHILVDRHMQGVTLLPGETKRGVEMLDDDVRHFSRMRRPGRHGIGGQILPRHPIEILDVRQPSDEERDEEIQNAETQRPLRPLHDRRSVPIDQDTLDEMAGGGEGQRMDNDEDQDEHEQPREGEGEHEHGRHRRRRPHVRHGRP